MSKGKVRTIKITPELQGILDRQREGFIKKFGREPNQPNDPIFFNPEASTPQPYTEEELGKAFNTALALADLSPASKEKFRRWYKSHA